MSSQYNDVSKAAQAKQSKNGTLTPQNKVKKSTGGRASRQKGDRRERELIEDHKAIGVYAERVPLSGATKYQGNGADLDVYVLGRDAAPLVAEVKARANGEGFVTLERWLGDHDALFLKRDRAEPLVVLPWRVWVMLLTKRRS